MFKEKIIYFFKKNSWLVIFALCFIYWLYLIFHTKMPVVYDSIDYESMGRLIYQKGWLDFFRTGPHREPFYPALIALSMAWANLLSVDYQFILKIFQVVFLFLTQILLIIFLRKFNVREGIIKGAILYFGVSPAIINAAFSVYYEIVVFPFVVIVTLLASSLWFDIHKERKYGVILWKAILFGAFFVLLTLGRGVFQVVFYFFMLPFCIWAVSSFFTRQKQVLRRLSIFILSGFVIFYSSISYIKTMNLRYNGNYVLCSTHHLGIFLASAYNRSQPATFRIIAANIAMIPGTGVCRKFFSQQECDYTNTEHLRVNEVAQRMSVIPKDRQEHEVVYLVLEKIIEHPFQYFFFTVVESFKMPFWESTQIGYVDYPEFLTKVYNHPIVRFGLRLFLGLITTAAFVFVTFILWRERHDCFSMRHVQRNMIMLFFAWLMIATYVFCYSLCCFVVRYALPIASMYIVCISFVINAVICHKFSTSSKAS